MPGPRILEFAYLAQAAYSSQETRAWGWTQAHYGELSGGFQGSYWRKATDGAGADVICAFAGTQPELGDDDIVTDIGFGGSTMAALGAIVTTLPFAGSRRAGLSLMELAQRGTEMLRAQIDGATELARQAAWVARQGRGRCFVTGHSLGGGLAQLIGAALNLPGVTFNAPAVSQLSYHRTTPSILNVVVERDPINDTERLGRRIGAELRVRGPFGWPEAHLIGNTISTITSGENATIADRRPF
ncbi:alpha/beta hydrolase family protein [Roseomonas sp. OT10]|uniref:lipase family protein n=1 Tax=Roseomonas cutis TaxID=2897332 RepID=UPI001E5A88F0|nr:alpha/beta hydrolase family protein [Roseomonas sp. OT10]UFN51052.1 alpha/beta hydrolase family protein [Roseomonas sp. OT10]